MHTTPHGASTLPLADVPFIDLIAELGRRLSSNVLTDEPRRSGPLRVAQVGNFDPSASTENELRKALIECGHEPLAFQESDPGVFDSLARHLDDGPAIDLVLWTRTLWPSMDFAAMRRMLAAARANGVPVVGYHLDLWWGLPRSDEIGRHPFFEVDLLCTADGGHQAEWDRAGIDHVWFPPAVSAAECVPADPDSRFAADVAFVGSHGGYHPESVHRAELVGHLRRRGARFWPEPGQHAVRGDDLRRLYATTKVNVGDSCFAGTARNYWSDRIPETLGRGGFLLHPWVEGIDDHFVDGEHLRYWAAGDWVGLDALIDHYLEDEAERRRVAEQGRTHVLEHHTYGARMKQLVDLLAERHLLRAVAA